MYSQPHYCVSFLLKLYVLLLYFWRPVSLFCTSTLCVGVRCIFAHYALCLSFFLGAVISASITFDQKTPHFVAICERCHISTRTHHGTVLFYFTRTCVCVCVCARISYIFYLFLNGIKENISNYTLLGTTLVLWIMLASEIAPTEIGKHANIIRGKYTRKKVSRKKKRNLNLPSTLYSAAQEELANMDVLVCGRCLRVFNFLEDFQSHKDDDACEKENSNLKDSLDTKPTIWAFTLWKATQLHTRKMNNSLNSWALYQHWVKLEESVREPWIVAGRTIQSFGKIGHGQLQDMPVRITKTVVNPNNNNNNNSTANSNPSSVSPTRSKYGEFISNVFTFLICNFLSFFTM